MTNVRINQGGMPISFVDIDIDHNENEVRITKTTIFSCGGDDQEIVLTIEEAAKMIELLGSELGV